MDGKSQLYQNKIILQLPSRWIQLQNKYATVQDMGAGNKCASKYFISSINQTFGVY